MVKRYSVAVVGATGLVGGEMLRVLEQRKFPVGRLVPVASERSAGREVSFRGEAHRVVASSKEAFQGVDLALFSAGASVSRQWCPVAADQGALVVDNSSAFRQDPAVPLCVPEVNIEAARKRPKGIVANPNCSTIQMVVALKPIHDVARIERIIVSTYQAISGAGAKAVAAFEEELRALLAGELKHGEGEPKPLAGNVLMGWTPDPETGYSEEELKMLRETRRILGDDAIRVSATAVRVPVRTAHAEAITVETKTPMTAAEARELLRGAPGVRVVDDFAHGIYPTPLDAAGGDDVLVGRIRDDIGNPGGVQMWVVADNLRKGAALNAVQIAEHLLVR